MTALTKKKTQKKINKEVVMKWVFAIAASTSILCVFLICGFLFYNGFTAMAKIGVFDFIAGTRWKPSNELFGILPMIVGSISVTLIAAIIGIPIGILCAIYLVYFCSDRVGKILKPVIDLLAGIPSIVYGFFGLVCIVPIMQDLTGTSGKGILTAGILLGMMILPTIINVSESSLRAVEKSYYEGALALGATHERSVFFVSVPAAKSGILAGVILGIGRAVGETMAVNYVAGNQAVMPTSILSGVRTLTTNIVLEMGYATDLHREALIATAVVLFIFILIINAAFSYVKRRMK